MKGLFSRWMHQMYVCNLERASGTPANYVMTANIEEANIVSSQIAGSDLHTLMVDLDVPAYLIPSETPGHSHLYIDVPMTQGQMMRIVEALADAGVVEGGYYRSSRRRGFTSLRFPWVSKRDTHPVPQSPADAREYRAGDHGSGESAVTLNGGLVFPTGTTFTSHSTLDVTEDFRTVVTGGEISAGGGGGRSNGPWGGLAPDEGPDT